MAEIEKNKYGIGEGDEHDNTQLSFFSFKDVLTATDNFSESNKLGEGGFGPVYKGKLSGDQEVAMKRLSKKSGQGLEEFMNELKLIAKLQHTYLVRLLGCCVEREEKILIYEYMPNRSLDKFLFGSSDKAKLDWGQRVKIAEGVAQGLLYIHKYSRLKIIHRDMKASNVLLDAAMNPKISDFGMARIFGIDQDEANTNHIVGTYGYMSPEYAFYGQFSEKSDVFSFGVLLLEIVSGKRNKDFYHNEIPYSLLCWVWEIWKEGKPEELIDPIVKNSTCCNLTEAVKLIHVGLLCVQEAPIDRPTMSSVTQMLSSNDSQSFPTPGEPSFTTRRAAAAENSDQVPVNCSNNQVTMSLPTGKLRGDQEVAMKRLSKKSGQGLEEFMNELKLIAKLQHTYLVRLLGCCVEREEKILIYEYMPNRSLDKFLFGASDQEKLTWGQRVKIAEGVAQGLLYIHRYSRLKIIHRDMKASNVLLDAAMNPKISDFGMARIFGTDQDEANTNRIVGTYGYMSPEYTYHGQFSEKSDVFSFGVLLLEIVSGKRNKDFYHPEIPSSLLCWVWELWKEGKPEELIDPAVKNTTCCNLTEAVKFIHVGLLCVQEAPIDRPTMASVTQMLSSNDSQSFTTPGELAFITRRAIPESSYQVPMNCSNNQITVSFPSGRL
ncbi:Cysteine-rich receptor-like protein kinase 10 [Linum perenne]